MEWFEGQWTGGKANGVAEEGQWSGGKQLAWICQIS